jgi:hypothetical protein
MNKLIQTAGFVLALATTSALAGCELYFDGHDDNHGDRWNYCGSDGYYTCHGEDCTWVGATCPTDGGGTGTPTGGACSANTDCAAGCYCASGTCEEGGFCTTDTDCGDGYHCDTDRSSCEPNTNPTCGSNADCANGTVCDTTTNTCTATCSCGSDEVAKANGFDYCDEARQTCMKGSDPVGDCAGALTCSTTPPLCDEHMVPGIFAGCYTGACRAIATCEAAPTCAALSHEDDCLDRTADCSAIYTGNNCKKSDGTACHAGDSGCTCESFSFSKCDAHAANAKVFTNGTDATAQINASYLHN